MDCPNYEKQVGDGGWRYVGYALPSWKELYILAAAVTYQERFPNRPTVRTFKKLNNN